MGKITLDELLEEYSKATKPKGKYWYRTYIIPPTGNGVFGSVNYQILEPNDFKLG